MYELGTGFNSHTSEDNLSISTPPKPKTGSGDADPAAGETAKSPFNPLPRKEKSEKAGPVSFPVSAPAAPKPAAPIPDAEILEPDPAEAARLEAKAAAQAAAKAKAEAAEAAKAAAAARARWKAQTEDAESGNVPAVRKPDMPPQVKPDPATPAEAAPIAPQVKPPAKASRFKGRHALALLSFVLFVIGSAAGSAWYLWTRAADQYASYMGFSVRAEEATPSITSLLGPLDLGGSSTPDADILYLFIQSQNLVAKIDADLDLRSIWSKVDPEQDPVFAYHPPGTVEELLEHWQRKVKVVYDTSTGLIELRVLAFTPEDAQAIAEAILAESTALINELSNTAREDAIGYARDELEKAVTRLKTARSALTAFRNRTQIVDPSIDLQGQASILFSLQQQLAEALISLDLLSETTRAGDPRIDQAERRIKVIQSRIDDEKRKLGLGSSASTDQAYATLVGEFESLLVDREFAEQTYTAALISFDTATAESLRQTRYLAAHVRPTLAEKSEFPQRWTLLGVITLFAFLAWSILALVGYSLRDRR